jgi:hypothetical protein
MTEQKCSCARLERLEGASVAAYTCTYLEQINPQTSEDRNRYRCRICGSEWEKSWPESKREGTRPSLVKQN